MTKITNDRMEQINLLLEPEGISVFFTEKFKNNGSKQGLVIHSEEKNCSPIFYPDEDFWQKSNEEIACVIKDIRENQSFEVDTKHFLNREFILQKVLPRVFSASNISLMQKDHLVFEQQMNLVFAFYFRFAGMKREWQRLL